MSNEPINLYNNNGYWKLKYYDATGRRRNKSMGSVKKISRRQAHVLAQQFISHFHANPGYASRTKSPTIGVYLDLYIASRTDLKPNSHTLLERTSRFLRKYFGEDCRMDRINRGMAAQWRTAIAKGELLKYWKKDDNKKKPSERTVYNYVIRACTIFNEAVRQDVIPYNPFDRLRKAPRKKEKDWRYVSMTEHELLLLTCNNTAWQVLVALCRLAGLRRGEALNLKWSHVHLDKNTITVIASKTGQKRVTPIVARLHQILTLAKCEYGSDYDEVIPTEFVRRNNLRRTFHAIIERAGLTPWAECFQVLRRNCATDWAGKVPGFVSAAWLGHSEEVAREHYLQVLSEYQSQLTSPNPLAKIVG